MYSSAIKSPNMAIVVTMRTFHLHSISSKNATHTTKAPPLIYEIMRFAIAIRLRSDLSTVFYKSKRYYPKNKFINATCV